MPKPMQSPHDIVMQALTFFPDNTEEFKDGVIAADKTLLEAFVAGKGDVQNALFLSRVYIEEYIPLALAGHGDVRRIDHARALIRAINRHLKDLS